MVPWSPTPTSFPVILPIVLTTSFDVLHPKTEQNLFVIKPHQPVIQTSLIPVLYTEWTQYWDVICCHGNEASSLLPTYNVINQTSISDVGRWAKWLHPLISYHWLRLNTGYLVVCRRIERTSNPSSTVSIHPSIHNVCSLSVRLSFELICLK